MQIRGPDAVRLPTHRRHGEQALARQDVSGNDREQHRHDHRGDRSVARIPQQRIEVANGRRDDDGAGAERLGERRPIQARAPRGGRDRLLDDTRPGDRADVAQHRGGQRVAEHAPLLGRTLVLVDHRRGDDRPSGAVDDPGAQPAGTEIVHHGEQSRPYQCA